MGNATTFGLVLHPHLLPRAVCCRLGFLTYVEVGLRAYALVFCTRVAAFCTLSCSVSLKVQGSGSRVQGPGEQPRLQSAQLSRGKRRIFSFSMRPVIVRLRTFFWDEAATTAGFCTLAPLFFGAHSWITLCQCQNPGHCPLAHVKANKCVVGGPVVFRFCQGWLMGSLGPRSQLYRDGLGVRRVS
jgi:hypothetical protein